MIILHTESHLESILPLQVLMLWEESSWWPHHQVQGEPECFQTGDGHWDKFEHSELKLKWIFSTLNELMMVVVYLGPLQYTIKAERMSTNIWKANCLPPEFQETDRAAGGCAFHAWRWIRTCCFLIPTFSIWFCEIINILIRRWYNSLRIAKSTRVVIAGVAWQIVRCCDLSHQIAAVSTRQFFHDSIRLQIHIVMPIVY